MDIALPLNFLLGLRGRRQMAVIATILLAVMVLLVYALALGGIVAGPLAEANTIGPFRWAAQ